MKTSLTKNVRDSNLASEACGETAVSQKVPVKMAAVDARSGKDGTLMKAQMSTVMGGNSRVVCCAAFERENK